MLQSSIVQDLLRSERAIRQSPILQELLEKERQEEHQKTLAQSVLSVLEAKLGRLSEETKNLILSIQELLNHLLRQGATTDKDKLEREVQHLKA